MFVGMFRLAVDEVVFVEQSRNPSLVPTAADGGASAVTYTVYDGDGNQLATGTATAFASLTGAYRIGFNTTSPTFQRGVSYTVRVSYAVSSAARSSLYTFLCT